MEGITLVQDTKITAFRFRVDFGPYIGLNSDEFAASRMPRSKRSERVLLENLTFHG
jgi:hypothetical protein